jgi:pimeloyl-ACP methyl ester carboxylesterase
VLRLPASADGRGEGGLAEREEPELVLISHIKSLVFEPMRTPASIVNYARQLLEFRDHDVRALMAGISVPTLFIDGESDRIVSARATREVVSRIPQAMRVMIEGGTHYMQCDEHVLIGDVVASFIGAGHAERAHAEDVLAGQAA